MNMISLPESGGAGPSGRDAGKIAGAVPISILDAVSEVFCSLKVNVRL
jgi:hypothetical protein